MSGRAVPTESLRRDHELIRRVVLAMEAAAGMLRAGTRVPGPVLGQVVEFATDFTDACHHSKEEGALFPALEGAGMPARAGPIAVMLAEHERSREIAARMAASARAYAGSGDAGALVADLDEYVEHMKAHLWKEDNRLFAMADARLAGGGAAAAGALRREEEARLAGLERPRSHYEGIAGALEEFASGRGRQAFNRGRPRGGGVIVSIEGVDQAGKRTQAAMLARALRARGRRASVLGFPDYSSPTGRLVRRMLSARRPPPPRALHCLMAANRWEALPAIRAASAGGGVAVMDRYYHSNLAYGAANGLPRAWLEGLDAGLPRPRLVVLLDAPPAAAAARKASGRDSFERDAGLARRAAAAYRRLAREGGWAVVGAARPRGEVHADVLRAAGRVLRA